MIGTILLSISTQEKYPYVNVYCAKDSASLSSFETLDFLHTYH